MNRLLTYIVLILTSLSPAQAVLAEPGLMEREDVAAFIERMVSEHAFERSHLQALFTQVQPDNSIITTITKPAESKPWNLYRPIFLTNERIEGGVEFWDAHRETLSRAERLYGVPAHIIIAILGVETRYGKHIGRYRVMDALTTLAFDYPPRAVFFRSELEHYLILTRDERIDPMTLYGSYAGAMGPPQFIPSSYRRFAVDFDGDGKRDLWNNINDVIGSIANYLSVNGWRRNEPIAFPALVEGSDYKLMANKELKPLYTLNELASAGVKLETTLPNNTLAILLELDGPKSYEYWVGLQNFYAITRYNRSPLYALAVYQLSEEIRSLRNTRLYTPQQATP